MAVPQIGTQTGITAARDREIQLHPDYQVAWTNRAATLDQLVRGHNDAQSRLAQLEAAVQLRPFA